MSWHRAAGAGAGGAADGGHAHGALAERARRGEARIGEFSVESDLRGPRLWFVKVRAPGAGAVWWRDEKPGAGRWPGPGLRACWQHLLGSWPACPRRPRTTATRTALPPPPPATHHSSGPAGAAPGAQGEALERFAQMTDWSYYEAARRFQRVLDAAGVSAALRAAGIQVMGQAGAARRSAAAAEGLRAGRCLGLRPRRLLSWGYGLLGRCGLCPAPGEAA